MRFFINRVSLYDNEKPCEEAFEVEYTRIDVRNADSPAKIPYFQNFPERIQTEWYGEGTNHHVEDGCIKRDFPGQRAWAIEVESLEVLYALYQKYGPFMIQEHMFSDGPEIRIVDGYLD